ncbi:MAG: FxLYD domain-containing protein [candidate division NC10 bacterium]|nr:FxLYD domain-containing protein [candidate division NC10 bacterium]
MGKRFVVLALGVIMLGSLPAQAGEDYRSKVKLTVQSPFMCAQRHFHIPGTAENQSDVTLGRIRIKGEAFQGDNRLMFTAFGKVFSPELKPGEVAAFDVEFLDIVGPDMQKVKDYKVEVVEAEPKP